MSIVHRPPRPPLSRRFRPSPSAPPQLPRLDFCLALLLPPTSTLDAVEASISQRRPFPHPSPPSRVRPTGEPPAHNVLVFPKASRVTIASSNPPPLDLSLSIVPRITLYSLAQLCVSLVPALDSAVRHPAAGFRPARSLLVGLLPTYTRSRLVSDAARCTSTQPASDGSHDHFLTAHAQPVPGTLKSRFWPMTPLSETQDLVLL